MIPQPPISTLFPYTTLFRSQDHGALVQHQRARAHGVGMEYRAQHRRGAGGESGVPRRAAVPRLARQVLLQRIRSEEHTSELQSHVNLVCRLLLEKKKSTRVT